MDTFFHFLTILALCITGLILFGMVLLVVVMRMPPNPLKELLTRLLWRIGATAGLMVVGLPLQPIPVVDGAYDLLGTLVLALYWLSFFRELPAVIRGGTTVPPIVKNVTPRKPHQD
jgi:hypothetical protein